MNRDRRDRLHRPPRPAAAVALRDQRVAYALLVVAIKPSERRLALQVGECRRAAGLRSFSLAIEARSTGLSSPRVNCCITPIERIVMKSRVRLKLSGPLIGRLLIPAVKLDRAIGRRRSPSRVLMRRRSPVPRVGVTGLRQAQRPIEQYGLRVDRRASQREAQREHAAEAFRRDAM